MVATSPPSTAAKRRAATSSGSVVGIALLRTTTVAARVRISSRRVEGGVEPSHPLARDGARCHGRGMARALGALALALLVGVATARAQNVVPRGPILVPGGVPNPGYC